MRRRRLAQAVALKALAGAETLTAAGAVSLAVFGLTHGAACVTIGWC